MTRRLAGRGLTGLVGLVALIALLSGGCSFSTPTPPPADPSPSPSPTPVSVDVAAAAVQAMTGWLKENSYTVTKIKGYSVTFADGGGTFSSKMTCEGGPTTHIGWQGVCAAPNDEALGVVVAVRVAAGPKISTVPMESDVAALCGDDSMPAWVKTVLETAKGEYCYLDESDG